MVRLSALGLLLGLVGCSGSFGAFDDLPPLSDNSDAPWPRLVDTPEAPEGRLVTGEGERATERLAALRGDSETRLARANQVLPVSDSLLARGEASQTRPLNEAPPVDEAGLLARAAQLQSRTADVQPAVDDADLLARAARVRAQAQIASAPVNEADLQARAALLRQRTSDVAALNEADLLSRASRSQRGDTAPVAPIVQNAPVAPRPPVPLRPLDTPVVSSSFEERARLARERAAGL